MNKFIIGMLLSCGFVVQAVDPAQQAYLQIIKDTMLSRIYSVVQPQSLRGKIALALTTALVCKHVIWDVALAKNRDEQECWSSALNPFRYKQETATIGQMVTRTEQGHASAQATQIVPAMSFSVMQKEKGAAVRYYNAFDLAGFGWYPVKILLKSISSKSYQDLLIDALTKHPLDIKEYTYRWRYPEKTPEVLALLVGGFLPTGLKMFVSWYKGLLIS